MTKRDDDMKKDEPSREEHIQPPSADDGSQGMSFSSEEAFDRLVSQYGGSVDLAAQAIGVEEETLRAWIYGLSSRHDTDTTQDRADDDV